MVYEEGRAIKQEFWVFKSSNNNEFSPFRHMIQRRKRQTSSNPSDMLTAGIPPLPSTHSIHDFHKYGVQHPNSIAPGFHFHLAASINPDTGKLNKHLERAFYGILARPICFLWIHTLKMQVYCLKMWWVIVQSDILRWLVAHFLPQIFL